MLKGVAELLLYPAMGRPQKVIQQRANGTYYVRLHKDGRRLTRSLGTKDPLVAASRASEAIRSLQEDERALEAERWPGDEPAVIGEMLADGTWVERETTWLEIAEPEELLRTDWKDLLREAVAVRKRSEGKDFSDSWYTNNELAIRDCPFKLDEASPKAIRKWIESMGPSGKGYRGRTVEMRCGALNNLINVSIKSGLLEEFSNPFEKVSFTNKSTKHIYTASEEDYKRMKAVLETAPTGTRLLLLIQMYGGTRVSEVQKREPKDFDLEAGTMTIAAGTGKNKSSERTVPLPSWLCEEIKAWGFQRSWPVTTGVNQRLSQVKQELTTHSFRHGFIRLSRELGCEPMAIEAFIGHRLPGMQATYGSGFSVTALAKAAAPIWERIDQLISRA